MSCTNVCRAQNCGNENDSDKELLGNDDEISLVMLAGYPVMIKTMIAEYLFASVLYYGQIETC